MADQKSPGYPADDQLELDPAQAKLLFEPTRSAIIDLLNQRAATTSELATALEKPKGTIGHHCKALERAGLIRVVRTKRVRAIEARYYGRTARTFVFPDGSGVLAPDHMLAQASAEIHRTAVAQLGPDLPAMSTLRFARVSDDRAAEWVGRLTELALEFATQPETGDRIYGFTVAVFPTTKPVLDDETRE